VRPCHQARYLPIPVAPVLEGIDAAQHSDQQVVVARTAVASITCWELEAFRPLPVLKHRARRAMLDRRRRRDAIAERADRVRKQERFAVSCAGSHGGKA